MNRRGRPPHPDVLTLAEWSVLDGVRSGLTNAEIAERLGISVNTVRYHVSNMLTKVGVADRQALAAWEGVPVSGVRFTRGGLLSLTRFLGLAAALVATAALAWLALDRLAGVTSEVPAGMREATAPPAEATPTPTVDTVLGRDLPFVASGDLWARAVVGSGSTGLSSPDIAVRPDGTMVFVANVGTVRTPSIEVGGPPLATAGLGDIILAELSPDGAHLWSRLLGGPGEDYASDIELTADGDILLSGTFEEGMDFGAGPVSSVGDHPPGSVASRDAFIARFDPHGDLKWVSTFGWEGRDDGGGVELLPNGDIVSVVVSSAPELRIGTTLLESRGDELTAVLRLSPEGDVVWAQAIPDATSLNSVEVDGNGDIVLMTRARGEVDSQRISGASALAKLSADGDLIWQATSDGLGQGVVGAELARDGSILVRGAFFRGPVDFGGGVVGTDEDSEGIVVRFSSDGEFEWAVPRKGGVEALTVDASGAIWIAEGDDATAGEAFVERLDADGHSEAHMLLGPPRTQPQRGPELNQQQPSGSGIARLGTLVVGSATTGDDEVLIAGRFFSRAVFPFGERLLSSHWFPHFLARIDVP